MANQSLPTPQIVLDANGLPVPGAQVFYYQSGTLTLISVYADQAGATLTTNPVVADGSGALPQTFVTVTAKAIIKDADGATLYTLDPVPVIQSVGSGAAQISFNPTITVPATDAQAAIELVDANWRAGVTSALTTVQPLDLDLTAIAAIARARGDIIRGGASAWEKLALGTVGQALVSNGTDVVYFGGEAGPTTASGTAVNFASIPASVNNITVFLNGISLSGTDSLLIQLGTAGAPETSGYGAAGGAFNTTNTFVTSAGTGFSVYAGNAAFALNGAVNFERIPGGNTWICSYSLQTQGTTILTGGGLKTLAGVLDYIRLLPSGANTFDAGTVSIRWSM